MVVARASVTSQTWMDQSCATRRGNAQGLVSQARALLLAETLRVTGLAVTLALGGDCLADLAVLRAIAGDRLRRRWTRHPLSWFLAPARRTEGCGMRGSDRQGVELFGATRC